jgi:hypothetical protein
MRWRRGFEVGSPATAERLARRDFRFGGDAAALKGQVEAFQFRDDLRPC